MRFLSSSLLVLSLLGILSCSDPKGNRLVWKLHSPDNNVHVQLRLTDGKLTYHAKISADGDTAIILEDSPLGVITSQGSLAQDLSFASADAPHSIHDEYTLLTGKQLQNKSEANELTVSFQNPENLGIAVTFRVYNDGFAFRYSFPESKDSTFTVTSEISGFKFPEQGQVWMQPYDSVTTYTPAYEKYFVNGVPVGTPSPNTGGWCFPALFRLDKAWVLVTESNLKPDYFGAHLINKPSETLYRIQQPDSLEAEGIGTIDAKGTSATPWRVVITGQQLSSIVESNLVDHVADEADGQRDFSWVKPGKASWSWWSDQASPRNLQSLKKFVDLSAEMDWEYTLVDANWNEMKGGTVEDLIKYANQKDVGVWLWYNSGGTHNRVTEQPRDIMSDATYRKEEMEKLQRLGVKGIKVDFFQSDKQWMIRHYFDILRDAADHHIMVNFHGCTIPRGWTKLWPNLLSMESARGGESYIFAREFPERAPLHNVHLAFTRNVIGPMDYTPVTFSNNRFRHLTSSAHELALAFVFETGILHFADRVEAYRVLSPDVRDLLRTMPVMWERTKFLGGSPYSEIMLARNSGDSWYVAYINGMGTQKSVDVDLSFLGDGEYESVIYKDNSDKSIASERANVRSDVKQSVDILPYGGFVMVLNKRTEQN